MQMNINTKRYIEKFIKIRTKEGRIIDFKLNNPQQRLYDIIKEQKQAKKPVRVIILKARQMGFSTLTESILFKETVTKFNRRTGIITHLATATTNLFNMSKLMLDNLPDEIKPSVKKSNAQELIFDNDSGTGLKSKIKCMTAGTSGVGRSDTFDMLHLSELAFWEGDVTATLTGLFQAVPNLPDTMIIIESTANGYEKFKELWDQAVNGESDFVPLFVAWYELPEYSMPYSGFKLTAEEEKIKELYNLTNEQLEWRRWCIRNNCQNDIEQFKQEYPSNPDEAFIGTGRCIFDKGKIIEQLQRAPKPIKQGYFTYNEEAAKRNVMKDIKWVNDKQGCIKIYKLPNQPAFTKYCIGGDTAGETEGDFFSADVIDAKTLEQVATLTLQTDEGLYARQVYCLGKYYGDAKIAIETNYSTYPQKKLEELDYTDFYIREVVDDYRNKVTKQFGFNTNRKTKPLILAGLVDLVRDFPEIFNDNRTLREMLTFVKKDGGTQEAEQGYHDDKVMSIAIAHQAVSQVVFSREPIVTQYRDFFDSYNTSSQYEGGEEITII